MWFQNVSKKPATRLDVINMHEQLNIKLEQREARSTGICPIRRELYSQCLGKKVFKFNNLNITLYCEISV